ncbi:MAG: A/G-specific adenine glycosylase [Bdellovibrionales bacterium]
MTEQQSSILKWYKSNGRVLPWRGRQDPYHIWISEVMLQQTTSQAVVPFFERFLNRFPTVASLAQSDVGEVLELWSGLGYYSRARNLHKAAQALHLEKQFPKSYVKLLEMPGFGPYTSRAVSSLAFNENVGLVDGNAIRVLSRVYTMKSLWWSTKGRAEIQEKADALVQGVDARDMNQALMDLGSMICTPTSPKCALCPWAKHCQANLEGNPEAYPPAKPKKQKMILAWYPIVEMGEKKKTLLLQKNDYAPFLKGQWLLPGHIKVLKKAPTKFLFKHTITHHDIYTVDIQKKHRAKIKQVGLQSQWVKMNELARVCPVSLVSKAVQLAHPEYTKS